MYILGVDGGGTKTKATLFHLKKGVLWSTQVAATNPHSTSFTESVMTVIKLIEQALAENEHIKNNALHIGLGIAGLGREPERRKWFALFSERSSHLSEIKEVTIENDGKIALYSATYGGDGIVSICGTGTLTFGIHQRETARVGGWGHLVGNEPGSGYYLGSQALQAIFDEEDGLAKRTLLTDIMLSGEGVQSVQELIPIIYQEHGEKQRIAAYARYVFQAMEAEDEVAKVIVEKAAKSIANYGLHLFESLFKTTQGEVPFVLAGGVFQNKTMVQLIVAALKNEPRLKVMVAKGDPVIGSIVTILQNQGYSREEIKQLL